LADVEHELPCQLLRPLVKASRQNDANFDEEVAALVRLETRACLTSQRLGRVRASSGSALEPILGRTSSVAAIVS
jgi:hypothetical protein